ncbi:replication-associated recombination protein A [Candidatus Peregrinibacteria bacterium]|nr:replication-associated recombination protein A [Candidatus Peregrinibacteria bacterium]
MPKTKKISVGHLLREPLANMMRPKTLEEFFGQEELVGDGKTLKKLIEADQLHSMIFFGPPGVGKTTLAQIITEKTASKFVTISAVTAGVPELRKVVAEAEDFLRLGTRTILFVDEIHRFNNSQQDFLLPHTERGTVILIGATTENPSFEVNSALLSRSQVFVFKALNDEALSGIARRALKKIGELAGAELELDNEAMDFLIGFANGDARNLLNTLEVIFKVADKWPVDLEEMRRILQKKNLRYDKKGEEHYNIISALHKSMRDSDPDGALYWMMRMLEGGEDPLYIARRLIRFASEDIGMADPHALLVAVAAKDACHFNGMPECEVNLAQTVVHLAMAPKSNALYTAIGEIKKTIKETGNLEVPLHIRNAPTKLMKEWGYGEGYKYAHNFEGAKIDQQHLPDQLKDRKFYYPTDRGLEAKIKQKLEE